MPIIGRDDEVARLSSMISSSGQNGSTRVIVTWGPPGIGKTALVEQVYSQFVLKQLFELYGWVQVSNPFNLMGFSQSLLSVLRPRSPQTPEPIWQCPYLMQHQSCLVVIDGLQSMENFWELVNKGFIYGHPNSCIVLITTEKSITTSMGMASSRLPQMFQLQVKPLDRASARKLFRQVYDEQGQNHFDGSYYLVVDKCCGLPNVIFAVDKYLSGLSREEVALFRAAVKDGKFIHELATNTQKDFVSLKGLLAWVDSDLKACPESLKLLLLYMLNFPQRETDVVRRKRLVWRWIAEGYIKNISTCDMVTEAEERIRELEDLTMMMMQVPPEGRDTWYRGCQLSGFSAEVLMSRAAEDQLFFPLEVSALTEGKKGSPTSRVYAGRHLRIDDNWERDEFVFRSLDLSRLRSLTISGRFEAFFLNDKMRALRVLDLEGATGVKSDRLENIPKLLPHLRFLSMRGYRGIDHLPNSIGDLRLLQTLDIRRTDITRLPNSILKLRKLQCLRAGHTMKSNTEQGPYTPWRRRISTRLLDLASCSWPTRINPFSLGVTMPRGMGRHLKALHTLGIVNVSTAGGEAIVEELRHLKQLRKVELYGINSCNMRGLRHLTHHLDSLSLVFTEDRAFATGINLDIGYVGSADGFRLKLHGPVGILQILTDYTRVTDLTLEINTLLKEDNMKSIGKLSWLRTLRLHFLRTQGGKLKFDANNDFPPLKILEITCLAETLDVEFAPGVMGTLEVLKFIGSLKFPPGGLHDLLSLREVWIDDWSAGAAKRKRIDKVLEEHPNKPVVIDCKSSWQIQRNKHLG